MTAIAPGAIRPIRLRLSRAKGFDLQAISLAANGLVAKVVTRATPLGNPFVVGEHRTRAEVVALHQQLCWGLVALNRAPAVKVQTAALDAIYAAKAAGTHAGVNLACACSLDGPCHGDTLLRVFNPGFDW